MVFSSRNTFTPRFSRFSQRGRPSKTRHPGRNSVRLVLETFEPRMVPAVRLMYGGPGSILALTELVSGATPTVTVSEPTANMLKIDLGTGHRFDSSSTPSAMGLTYSVAGNPAASQSATVNLSRAGNVSNLQTDLAGDTLVLGPIADASGGLANVGLPNAAASAGTITVMGLNTSQAPVGNSNVDLKAAGNLTVRTNAVIDAGMGTVALAADVNADGSGNDGGGTLAVQAGAMVVSDNPSGSAITLRGAAVNLDTSANRAAVGARRVLGSTATPFATSGLAAPAGLAFDASGNLYVANYYGYPNTVSKVTPDGNITCFVGCMSSVLNQPDALAFDASGNLYVANGGDNTISKVTPAGIVTPFVHATQGLSVPRGLAFDASGNLYVSNRFDGRGNPGTTVSKVTPDGSHVTPFATGLNGPLGLAFDASGNLYVANADGNTVSRVPPSGGMASTFVNGGLSTPHGLAFDASGNLYIANYGDSTVSQVAKGSNSAMRIVTAGLIGADGLAFDARGRGNLYVSSFAQGNTVSKVTLVLAPVAGGVVIRSSLPDRPMLLGDTSSPVDGINLSSAALADIQTVATGTLTVGDASQTGDITFRTAQPATTAGAALVVSQAPGGPGTIVLDDAGAAPALDGNGGSVHLTAGAGGIVAAHPGAGLFEITNGGAVGLDTGGTAGTAANPLHISATILAAHAASGLTLVTQVSQLAADGGSGGASVRNGGDLTVASVAPLTGVTTAGDVSVRTTGNLLVNANITSTGAGNLFLQGDDSLTIDPAATVQASAGIIRLVAGFGALGMNSVLTVDGNSLLASAALLDLGFDSSGTARLVPGGNTPIILDGGGNGVLDVNDTANATGRTFTLTDTTLDWGGPTLTYTGLAGLTVEGGSGGNTFTIASTSATATATLVGGSGGDTFQFTDGASLGGSIIGGGAATLDYSAYSTSVVVNLQTSLATGVGGTVSGILAVTGGSGTPAGAGVYNLLIGSGGNVLTGGFGRRNILVAGASASTLNAGDGEDLLIAGSTAYDTEAGLASWLTIAAYWAGTDGNTDDYATRVANLMSGNGVPLLDATTVLGNGGGNVLNGNGALALLYSDGADSIAGFDPDSQQVLITP